MTADPFSVAGIRDYALGDSFNTINFKATAKSFFGGMPKIKVNKFDNCSDRIIMIYLNFGQDGAKGSTAEYEACMETALSLTASVIYWCLKNGSKVGFAANCRMVDGRQSIRIPMMSGTHHVEELLRELAKIWLAPGCSFAALLGGDAEANVKEAEVFIMTPYIDESFDDEITALKRKNTVRVIEI